MVTSLLSARAPRGRGGLWLGATIAESTGRAAMFVGSVSAGLVALGLVAAATRIGTAFYTFGLVLPADCRRSKASRMATGALTDGRCGTLN